MKYFAVILPERKEKVEQKQKYLTQQPLSDHQTVSSISKQSVQWELVKSKRNTPLNKDNK